MASVTTGDPSEAESGASAAAVGAGQPRDPRLRADLRPPRAAAGRTTRSPGPRTWSSRGSGPESGSCGARRSPSAAPILARDGTPLAEGPAASRSSPLGAAAQSVAGRGRLAHPRAGPRAVAARIPARARRPGPAASSSPSTGGSPGGRAASWSRSPATAPIRPAAGRCSPAAKPVPGKPVHTTIDPGLQQAAVAALGGQLRRRRRAGRPRRLGAGAGGDRLLRPSAAGLDLQGDHDHRGARGGGRRAHGPVPGPDLDRGRRPRGRQRPQRGLWRQLRRGLREVVQQRLRPARRRRSARSASSRRPSGTASTRPPACSTRPPFGP